MPEKIVFQLFLLPTIVELTSIGLPDGVMILEAIKLKPTSHRLECQQRQGDMSLSVYSKFNIMLRTQLRNKLRLYFC